MRTLNEFYNVFVIQADNIKLINYFISLVCIMNLPKYAYLFTSVFGLTVLLLLYSFTIVAEASLGI